MNTSIFLVLLIPFLGTTLGSGTVFFLKNQIKDSFQKLLLGFASGVMIAASVWSLIIPAIDSSEAMEKFAFLPAAIGIGLGMAFLFLLDMIIPHLHPTSDTPDGPASKLKKNTMLMLSVTLHNIPEGMAVGVVAASMMYGEQVMNLQAALALSIGIALQNFPEGAIISLPLADCGVKKSKTFILGVLSGIVEPLGALLTLLLASFITPALPYLLSFAAGAMIYVVVEELIPEMTGGKHSHIGTIFFAIGFSVMMILDVLLG